MQFDMPNGKLTGNIAFQAANQHLIGAESSYRAFDTATAKRSFGH